MEDGQWQVELTKLILNGAEIPKFRFGVMTNMDETGVVVSRSSYDRKPDLKDAADALRDQTTSSPPVIVEVNYDTILRTWFSRSSPRTPRLEMKFVQKPLQKMVSAKKLAMRKLQPNI